LVEAEEALSETKREVKNDYKEGLNDPSRVSVKQDGGV